MIILKYSIILSIHSYLHTYISCFWCYVNKNFAPITYLYSKPIRPLYTEHKANRKAFNVDKTSINTLTKINAPNGGFAKFQRFNVSCIHSRQTKNPKIRVFIIRGYGSFFIHTQLMCRGCKRMSWTWPMGSLIRV